MTYSKLHQKLIKAANNRCGYCLIYQQLINAKLEIEHIIPKAKGGINAEENLWLSCGSCNRYKGTQTAAFDEETRKTVKLFNPRRQNWAEHFSWSADGAFIVGNTAVGRATVNALKLNSKIAVEVRRNWILAGWHPPKL